jgi:hypothetical protein
MRMYSKAAAVGVAALAVFVPMSAAHADPCDEGDVAYCSPDVPRGGGADSGEVLPSDQEQHPTGGPATAEEPKTDAAPAAAPSGSLPFTGGDVVGMTVIGAGALGVGALLVRKSKKVNAA